jgi:uncharacterized protein with GYD domain
MPHYLVQLSYTKEAVATLVENPQNRLDAARPAYEALGIPSAKASWPSGTTTSFSS